MKTIPLTRGKVALVDILWGLLAMLAVPAHAGGDGRNAQKCARVVMQRAEVVAAAG